MNGGDALVAHGRLLVVPAEPALGVGRVVDEAIVDGAAQLRLLLYKDGTLIWRARAQVAACPPGTAVDPLSPSAGPSDPTPPG